MKALEELGCKIPFGRENAISRADLAIKLGLSDRKMREAVERARIAGLMVCNNEDGSGYYQTADLDELYIQYKRDTARAMSILSRRKPIRDKLKAAGYAV